MLQGVAVHMRLVSFGFGLVLSLCPIPAQAALDCPQAALVSVAGQGEGLVEGVGTEGAEAGLCLVRLADGRLIRSPAADLTLTEAGDTPPILPLPSGFLACESGAGRFGLALAPGLYIHENGQAGRLSGVGADLRFDSGPLAGTLARIEGEGARLVLALPRRAKAVCTGWTAG